MMNPLVELKNVHFSYNGHKVLQQINLEIKPDDFIAVIGPNGGGKTTLIKIILGLLKPDRGKVSVMGKPPQKTSAVIGYVPQNVNINFNFPITALDVVMMGVLNMGNKKADRNKNREKALQTLELLGIKKEADKKIGQLSGGQRQRVFIARALMTQPRLLLLDEPTASIDTRGQTEFYRLLKRLNERVAILVVSHDLYVISQYVKSVACVNTCLHYHPHEEITGEILETMYACSVDDICQVQIMANGLPRNAIYAPQRTENGTP